MATPRLLFTVTDRFEIRGRGVILTPGVPVEHARPGLEVEIVRPDGARRRVTCYPEIFVHFLTLEAEERWRCGPRPIYVTGLTPEDVPLGAEVYAVDDAPTPG